LKREANQEEFLKKMKELDSEILRQSEQLEMETAQLEIADHILDRTSKDLMYEDLTIKIVIFNYP